MSRSLELLRRKARTFENATVRELMGVFTPWLDLANAFGQPQRDRLFSPLTNLLALLGPGPFGGPLL